MDFYVGWSHSDAIFTDYFPNCPILISALPDNKGKIKKFTSKPKKLIVDCGSVYYVKQKNRPSTKSVLDIQRSFLWEDCRQDTQISFVHLDEPMLKKTTLSEKYGAMEKSLINAYEYQSLFYQSDFPTNIQTLGVIQGYDQASIQYSALELKKMGYKKFGIGSLLLRNSTDQVRMIKYAANVVGASNLHVFGVTGIKQMYEMVDMGVSSFDSTRPTMAAAYFQVFYSKPFRTYYLKNSRAKLNSELRLGSPLECDCPVCRINAEDLFKPSPRVYMRLRSIHNYYHLMSVFQGILKEKGVV